MTLNTYLQGRSMVMHFLLSVSLSAFALIGAASCSAADKDGKFHLVYLVSAVDVKPGSKVYVDPVFFTDGKDVRNVHDYCKKTGRPLSPNQIAGDIAFINTYCANKNFTLSAKGYSVVNNYGQKITLGSIEFGVVDTIQDTKEKVMLGKGTVSSYTPGTITPPKWLRGNGASEYFFLMTSDGAVLNKIVPVSPVTEADVQALVKRAEEFSKIAKGRVSGNPISPSEIEKAKRCYAPSSIVEFRLENPLITDLDSDGTVDMFVHAYSALKHESDDVDGPLVECLTYYEIFGNGETYLRGNTYRELTSQDKRFDRYITNGYALEAPLVAVRLTDQGRSKVYWMSYSGDCCGTGHPTGLLLLGHDRRGGFSLSKLKGESQR